MTNQAYIAIGLRIDLQFDEEANVWVGHCPALDVLSQGETQEIAFEATKEAVEMTIEFNETHPRTRSAAGPDA